MFVPIKWFNIYFNKITMLFNLSAETYSLKQLTLTNKL